MLGFEPVAAASEHCRPTHCVMGIIRNSERC